MRKSAKWIRNIILLIFLLVLLFILVLHTPFAKDLIRGKLEAYLTAKTGGQFHIASVNYRLPKWVQMNGVSVRSHGGDTILTGDKIRIDLNLFKVLKGTYEINRIELEKVYVDAVKKPGDSTFNYQFLFDAFTTKSDIKDSTPLVLSLKEIHIIQSGFNYSDPQTGTAMKAKLGKVDMFIDSLDVYKNQYAIRESHLTDVYFNMRMYKAVNPTVGGLKPALPFIKLGQSHIERTHLIYKDEINGINTDDLIKEMYVSSSHLHPSGSVTLGQVLLNDSYVSVDRPAFDNSKLRVDTVTGKLVNDSLGVFHVRDVKINNTSFVYNDISKRKRSGFDLHHMMIRRLKANGKDIDYTGKKINASLAFVSGQDKSGFTVDSLHGNFLLTDSLVTVENLVVVTPQSRMAGTAVLYPFSLLPGNRSRVQNRISLKNNVLARRDLELLIPDIMRTYRTQLAGISALYLTAEADGNANRMVVHRLVARSNRNDISIDAAGIITNASSKNNMRFDARINQLNLTRNVVAGFMDKKMRGQVQLPPAFNIRGNIKGSFYELNNDLTVSSAYGFAGIKGTLRNFMVPSRVNYNLRILARNLETGKWIKQDSLFGKANGTIALRGSGTDFKNSTIQAGLDLASFRILKHTYTGIHVDLTSKAGNYDFKGYTTDPALVTSFDGSASLNQKYPTGKGVFNIKHANPYALGLYNDSLTFSTLARVDLANLDPASLNALVRLDSTVVRKDSRVFRVDSLLAKGYTDSGKTFITLNSAPLNATLKGIYRYTELPAIFQHTAERYLKSNGPLPPVSAGYSLDLSAELKSDPLYAVFLPGLFFDKNILMRGRIDDNRTDSSRYVDISAPGITYNGNHLANFSVHAVDINDSLRFNARADTIKANSILLYTTTVQGGLHNNNLTAALSSNDKAGRERYAASIRGNGTADLYNIQLMDQLKLNYDTWQVNGNNKISFGTSGFNVSQLAISKGAQQVSANSISSALGAPIDVKVDNFALHNLTSLFNTDSLELDGKLNALVRVSDFNNPVPTLDGSVTVDSLLYQGLRMGRVDVKAATSGTESVTLSGSLTGYGNNVTLAGTYNKQNINAQINLNPVLFKTIEPFTKGSLTNSSGYVYGPINITGSVKQPEWNGSIRFDSVRTRLTKFGSTLAVSNQTLDLKYPVMGFNNFSIKDSLGHELLVNGTLTQGKGIIPEANLTVKATDFTIMNSTSAVNNQLYGIAVVDVDASVKGPVTTPDIDGRLALKGESNITYVKQPLVASAKDRENVMTFVDMDTVRTDFVAPAVERAREYRALNYNLNIDISKDAQFNIIVDPLTRDQLQVKGAGELNAGVSPGGLVSITGAYNLSQGTYEMNYQFIRRKFDLQEGSTLVFTGDPMNAQADITAIYNIEASPYDLVSNEVDNSAIDTRLYSQKVPFEVLLRITGTLTAPELNFDVRLKQNVAGINYNFANTIDTKLLQMRQDPSTMNKQVFGLLVMGRFIGDQSTDFFGNIGGSSGFNAGDLVKESVSRFLSDAVNQLASNLLRGVDIAVGLSSAQDYSTATERTDLNVALSRRFMDDRLTITVGKSFTVAGDEPVGGSSSQFMPDITTTYKLSKDGRYMLKAYQRNQYEAILDGYFIETGVAFSLVMDYNKFRELLHKNRK